MSIQGCGVERLLVVALVLMGAALGAGAQQRADSSTAEVDMQWGVKIPARDGVILNATVYQPHAQKDPLPVIFTFTPYIGDSYTDRAMYFARHGYVYALVDVRGRGIQEANSGRLRTRDATVMTLRSGWQSRDIATER